MELLTSKQSPSKDTQNRGERVAELRGGVHGVSVMGRCQVMGDAFFRY